MKKIALILGLIAVAALAGAHDEKANLMADFAKVNAAIKSKDVNGFARLYRSMVTPNFVYVQDGVPMGLDRMVLALRLGVGSMQRVTEVRDQVLFLNLKGNKGTAKIRHTLGVVTQPGPDRRSHAMSYVSVSHDSFVKLGGRWKLSKSVWKTEQMTLDGSVIKAGKPTGGVSSSG